MNVEPAIDKRRGYRLWRMVAIILPMALLLAMGWWAGETSARRTDVEMRERLLRQATELAATIDPEWASQLTFTAADKNSPVYELIRNQMTALARIMPLRGIYSMRLRAGTIFFGPEDYPVADPMASPPGTEYKRPSAELLGAFRKRSAITVGPVTDEYGTFISAAAPVLDPQNGQVLMMVGVDILAGEWRSRIHAARRGPWLATFMMMLVFSVSLVATHRLLRRAPPGALQLRSWIVTPAALAILFGLLLYGAREIHEFNRATSRNMQQVLLQAQSQWNQNIARQARIMGRRIEEIKATPGLKQAWLARDLPTLTALAQPVLAALKRECGVTHLTFVAPDRTVFLRAHKPDRRGDRLDRCALLAAERTGYDFWGFDLDPMGMLGLRYVKPWQENARTIGYLELGLEINRPVQQLATDMKVDVVTLIHKKPATRQAFEHGRERFGFVAPWETYADMAVTHQTMAMLPGAVTRWINKHGGQAHREGEVFTARLDAARFACGVLELPTSMGRETLDLLIIREITPEFQTAWSALFLHLGLAIVLFGGILALIWKITSRAERQLKSSFAAMQASEARYHMLFDTMADGIVHVTPDGRIVQANAAAERIIGLKRSEIERLNCNGPEWNGIRPDGTPRPYEERALQRALQERRTVRDVEMGVRRADGTYFWINSNAAPIINAAGELEGAVGSFIDITARKESEGLLQLQRDLALAVLAQDSLEGALQQLLELVCRIPGVDSGGVYRVDGTTGRAELLAHRGLSDAFVASIAHVEPDNFRARLLLDGQPVYVNGAARPAVDVDGVLAMEGLRTLAIIPQHFNGRVVAALNLSSHTLDRFSPVTRAMIEAVAVQMGGLIARLDAQNAARQVRQNLEMVFETMTDMLFILDEAGRVMHANRAAKETLGYATEKLARLTVLDLHPPDRREEVAATVADMLAGRRQTCLVPLVDRSGRLVEVETKVHVGQWDGRMALFGISRDISARVRAENEIIRAKEDWERTFASVPDLIALLDSDHRITRVNQALAARLGCTPEQAVGRHCYEVIHGFSAPPACCPHARMLVSGKQEHTELEEAGLGGFFDVTVTPLRNASGAFIGSVHVAHDITDRKKAEQTIRESERKYRQLVDTLQEGVWLIDKDAITVFANPRMAEMLGYSVEDMLGKSLFHYMDERGVAIAERNVERRKQGVVEEHEFEFIRKDGSRIHTLISTTPVTDENGNYCGALAGVFDITDRKKAEQELKASEEKYRDLVENINDVIFTVDIQGVITYISPVVERLLGYPAAEVAGTRFEQYIHPADLSEIRESYEELLEGRLFPVEHRLRRKEGDYCWVRTSSRPIRDAAGRPVGLRGVIRDIAEKKKADLALQEKEVVLSRAQQIAHVGSWELDDATHELRWSDETFRMFGYAPHAVTPTIDLFVQCIHPDDRAHMQAAVTAAWDARTQFSEEHRIVRPDGEERIVHERAEVLFNDAGQPIKWMGTVQDITERKRVEQALMESEASFRNLAENTWYGMVVSRADEQIVFGNRRACELLGYSPKALLRIKTGDVVMPADYPMLRQRLQQRLEGRAVGKYEVCLRRADGTTFPAEIAGTRTIWQGEMCALFLFQDLTERKRLENEILQVSDWEKTRIGQDLHDTLGQQLAGVTYLSQALGSAWKSQPPAETEKTLAQLAVESQRAVELVRQVARGLTPVAQRPGGLADALCGMAERMRQIHGVNCVFEAAAKVEIADRQMASHLFFLAQEAVTNAARHGQARHIVVRLSQTDDSQAELSIQDNGVGLPVDRPAGSGLGLRIMQYRADLINGTLAIERVESGGTRVVCRFTTGGG